MLTDAFEKVCRELELGVDDPVRAIVAPKVIEFSVGGFQNSELLRAILLPMLNTRAVKPIQERECAIHRAILS